MPTVIDSLIISLGLDPSKFTKGQAEAVSSLKKTEEQAVKSGKEIEARGRQAAESLSLIKNQVIGLFAAFTAGAGLREFISSVTKADAAAGLFAKNVGLSTSTLTAWEGVARRSGAEASDVDASFGSLSSQLQQFAMTGNSSMIPYFRALGVAVADSAGNMRPLDAVMLDLADRFKGMSAAQAQAFGRGLGLTPGMVNVLLQGRDAVRSLLAEQEKIGHANQQDAAAALALQNAWRGLTDASENLGRQIMTALNPALVPLLKGLTGLITWAHEHPKLVQAFAAVTAGVAAAAIAFAALTSPIILTTAVIAAMAAGVALLWDDWRTFTEGGKSEFEGLWITVEKVWKLIVAVFSGSSTDIRQAWDDLIGNLKDDFLGFIDWIANVGPKIYDAVKGAFSGALDWVEGRWNAIKGAFGFGGPSAPSSAPSGGAAPSSGRPGAPTPVTAAQIVAQLTALGWSREAAIGIAANVMAESGGNPSATGDNGAAFGLAQWHADRQAAFERWAGHSIRSATAQEQVGFIDYELRSGSERKAGAALAGAKTAEEAASIGSRLYERPADAAGEAARRARIASALAGGPGPTPDAALSYGPRRALAAGGAGASNSTSNQVNVGSITVNAPQADDSDGIARGLQASMRRYSWLPQANSGLE